MSLINNTIRSSHKYLFSRCILPMNNNSYIELAKYLNSSTTLNKSGPDCRENIFKEDKKLKAFKMKQAKMQCDDGYPVHLKGGILDKILYHLTVIGCIIGVGQCIRFIYLQA